MSRLSDLVARMRSLLFARREDQDLTEEIRFHIDKDVERNLAAGLSPREARRQAHIKFGGVERMRERAKEARGVGWVEVLIRDAGVALRRLRRDAGFTSGVVLLLALGIGANVGVFSIVNGVLLRPLPYRDAGRLVAIRELAPQIADGSVPVNERHFLEWRACECLEGVALSDNFAEANLTGDQAPERVPMSRVTPNTFDLLGTSAQLGRTFVAEDGDAEMRPVVISDGLWRRRFAANPGVVGTTIGLDGREAVVVGVLPPDFRHFDRSRVAPDGGVDIYIPWNVSPRPETGWFGSFNYEALGKLREGVTIAAARAELDGIQAAIAENFPLGAASYELHAQVTPLREFLTGRSRAGLLLLLASVGMALLVACFNVANLMLVRATIRRGEAALRTALGAPRWAIFREAVVESVLLAVAGSVVGVALTVWVLRGFAGFAPPGLPRADEVGPDWTVLLAGLCLGAMVTLIFGVVPALRMTQVDPQTVLRACGRGSGGTGKRLRHGLVSLEVGLSTTLLVVAGLLTMSFVRLQGVERGYDAANVLTAEVSLPYARYGTVARRTDDDPRGQFWRELTRRLESEPGVVAAGLTSRLPLRGDSWGDGAVPEGGFASTVEPQPDMQYRWVSPNYWSAMGVPVMSGRAFDESDRPGRVAVLSARVARALWPDEDPVGRRFYRGSPDDLYEVVGIVPDVHAVDLADEPVPLVYLPRWEPGAPITSVAIRTVGDPRAMAATLREVVAAVDPELAISDVETMTQIDRRVLGERRFALILVIVFGVASLLIAALGTYSVLAYAVAGRGHELAVRLSLGAQPGRIKTMVIRQGIQSVLVGLALGLGAALVLGRALSGMLFSVSPTDPVPFALVMVVTLVAAAIACWVPARRAASANALDLLRGEFHE